MNHLTIRVLFILASCGNVSRKQDDAGVAPPQPALELVSGSTRMSGPTYTPEVQVGHGVRQGKVTSSTYKLEGNTAVKP